MKDLSIFIIIVPITIMVIWKTSDVLFKNKMKLLSDDKKRQRYVDFLSHWSININREEILFFNTAIIWIAFYILLALILRGIEWILDYNFNGKMIEYFVVYFSSLPAIFIFRTNLCKNTYLRAIRSTKRVKLKSFIEELNNIRSRIEKRIRNSESEILKTNRVIEDTIVNENAKNKLDIELAELQIKIINQKKVLNEVIDLLNKIYEYLSWEMWFYKKAEDQLDDDDKEKLKNYYNIENIYHPDFFDTLLEHNKFSHILYKIGYDYLRYDLKKQNKDFAKFADDNGIVLESAFKDVVSQYKSISKEL